MRASLLVAAFVAALVSVLPAWAEEAPSLRPDISQPATAAEVGEMLLALGFPTLGRAAGDAQSGPVVPAQATVPVQCTKDFYKPCCCFNLVQRNCMSQKDCEDLDGRCVTDRPDNDLAKNHNYCE